MPFNASTTTLVKFQNIFTFPQKPRDPLSSRSPGPSPCRPAPPMPRCFLTKSLLIFTLTLRTGHRFALLQTRERRPEKSSLFRPVNVWAGRAASLWGPGPSGENLYVGETEGFGGNHTNPSKNIGLRLRSPEFLSQLSHQPAVWLVPTAKTSSPVSPKLQTAVTNTQKPLQLQSSLDQGGGAGDLGGAQGSA